MKFFKLLSFLLVFAPGLAFGASTSTPPGCPALSPCTLLAPSAGSAPSILKDTGIVNPAGHSSDTVATMNIGFGPLGWTSPGELLFQNNLYGQNVISVQNNNSQGFGSYVIRGEDGIEHSAMGCPNIGNTSFILPGRLCGWEVSYYDGNVPGLNIAQITASISGTDMNVTAVASGTVVADSNCYMAATGTILKNMMLVSQTSGTPGGIGHYQTNQSQTLGSSSITCAQTPSSWFLAQTGNINGTNKTGVPRIYVYGSPYGLPGFSAGHISFNDDALSEFFGADPVSRVIDVNTHLEVGNNNSAQTLSGQAVDIFGGICMGGSTSGRGSSSCTDTLNINDTAASIRLKNSTTNGAALRITNTGVSSAAIIKFIDADNSSVLPLQIPLDGKATVIIGGAGQTVATLPTCAAGNKGARTYVTDALGPTYLVALVGGGAVVAPAFCNGSGWVSD